MFELIIKNSDGSEYWKERFNSSAQAQRWIEEEKTRSYWKKDFTYEVIDHSPPPESDVDREARETVETTKRAALAALRARLNELDSQADLTAAEVKEQVRKFLKFIKLKGFLD